MASGDDRRRTLPVGGHLLKFAADAFRPQPAVAGAAEIVQQILKIRFRPLRRPRQLVKVRPGAAPWLGGKQECGEEVPAEEFISREVDPILDKIAAKGFESLTEKERKILDEARKRMK